MKLAPYAPRTTAHPGRCVARTHKPHQAPEFAREYVGQVKLAYIDPPFNTGQAFTHYDDALEHSVWLTMMRDRIRQTSLRDPS